jgi:hypothetical protein
VKNLSEKESVGLDYSHNNKLTLEASSYADFTQFLFTSGYKLGKIQAGFDSLKKLETYNMIILSTPNNANISEQEIEILEEYVRNGGGLMIVSSSGGDHSNRTNLNELVHKFGFEFVEDEVYDSMSYVNLQKRPLLTKFKAHMVTEQIKKIVFSSACSLKVLDFVEDEDNIKIEILSQGGLNCWRKVYSFSDDGWNEEDSPKIPLMVAVEYYKGKVMAFGNLSMFSSLGSEYGFSAFDNDLLIANAFRYLTSGIIHEGKVITVNLNLDLFYWAQSVLNDQSWDNVSDVINLSLKYLKDNYKSVIDQLKLVQEEKIKRRKAYEEAKGKAKAIASEDKVLEFVTDRKRGDLEDIMSAITGVSGEEYELEVDLDGKVESEAAEEHAKAEEEVDKEEVIVEEEEAVDKDLKQIEEEIERQIEDQLDEQTIYLEGELKNEIEKEQELIIDKAKEELEKDLDKKIEEEGAAKIKKALEDSIGKDIERIKKSIMKKAKVEIMRNSEAIIEAAKSEIEKIGEKNRDQEQKRIIEEAGKKLEEERKKIMASAKKELEKNRKERIMTVKDRELKILKENQEFFNDIMAATDMFSGPILELEEYSDEDIAMFEEATKKKAIWKSNPTKKFKEWLKKNKK